MVNETILNETLTYLSVFYVYIHIFCHILHKQNPQATHRAMLAVDHLVGN